jgi:hypothetical protein
MTIGGNNMKVGDKVVVIHSPYLSVKNGTIGTIIRIEDYLYSRKKTYILDTKPNSLFYENEIKKYEKEN